MNRLLSAAAAAALSTAALAATLVENGQPRAVVVTAANPTPVVQFAVKELVDHVKLVSGASLPVLSEDALPPGDTRHLVLVGDGKLAAEMGATTAALAPESTLVQATETRLLLIGGDRGEYALVSKAENANGTLYAVYDFIEKELGVRWLWPGPAGLVAPPRPAITVAPCRRAFTPPLIQRGIRGGMKDWNDSVANLGLTPKMAKTQADEYSLWARRRRLGRSAAFSFGHAFNFWLQKYGKQHPDWFAMMPDGTRVTPEKPYPNLERAKLCETNLELIDFIAKQGMEYLEKNPGVLSFSACPNDSRGYCMCPACKALDHPDGIQDTMNYPGMKPFLYPSLSDRMVWFWNQIAQRMGDRYPGRYIGAYAYSNYRFPPLREKLSSRVVIAYVGYNYLSNSFNAQSRKDWAGWAATGCKMFLRPNLLLVGHGFPINYARELAADVKECARTGMLGTDFDSMTHQYASQAPIFDMLTRIMWDPSLDPEAVYSDFLASAYGPAEPAMRRYWDEIEKTTKTIAATSQGAEHDQLPFEDMVPTVYAEARLAQLRAILDEARKAAAQRPDVLKRIDVAAVGLDYAEIQRDVLVAVKALGKSKKVDSVMPLLQRKAEFFRAHLNDWTIGLHHVYWREARSAAHAQMYGAVLAEARIHPNKLADLPEWRFITDPDNTGLDKGYEKADFNDAKWKTISTLTFWEQQGYRDYDGYAWYRVHLTVPQEWKKHKKIILRFGAVDESFSLYVDGKLAKEWPYDGAKDPDLWKKPRPVDVTSLLNYGGENVLAVRVQDTSGAGGIWKSVLVIYED